MSGYVDETNYCVVRLKQSFDTFISDISYVYDVSNSVYRYPTTRYLDLPSVTSTNIEYHGIDQDDNYIYFSPYGNYNDSTSARLQENKVTRILKDNFVNASVEDIIIETDISCQGQFTGVSIDKTNNHGYLSPYMKDLSGVDGSQTDFGTVVRFSTQNYVSNTTNIKAVNLETNYNTSDIPGSKLT